MNAWFWLGLSGVFGILIGDGSMLAAMKRIGCQLALAVQCLVPPVTGLFAYFFLGESLTFYETTGILLTTLAIAVLVLWNSKLPKAFEGGVLAAGLAFAFLAVFAQAAGLVIMRHQISQIDPFWGSLMRLAPAALFGLVYLRKDPQRSPVFRTRKNFSFISLAGFGGAFIGIACATASVKLTKVGLAAAIQFSFPLWVYPFAWFFDDEPSDFVSLALTTLAVAGVALICLA